LLRDFNEIDNLEIHWYEIVGARCNAIVEIAVIPLDDCTLERSIIGRLRKTEQLAIEQNATSNEMKEELKKPKLNSKIINNSKRG
jgi:hypothetical protein